jgi:hypothetical protein
MNLDREYERWRVAFGEELTRREYFEQLLHLEETGEAVKSVIRHVENKRSESA